MFGAFQADSSKAVTVVRGLASGVRGGYQAMARATEYLPSGLHTIIDSVKQGAHQAMELMQAVAQVSYLCILCVNGVPCWCCMCAVLVAGQVVSLLFIL